MDAIGYGAKNTGRAIQGGYRTNALGKTGIGRYASGAVGAGRAALGTTGGKIGIIHSQGFCSGDAHQ